MVTTTLHINLQSRSSVLMQAQLTYNKLLLSLKQCPAGRGTCRVWPESASEADSSLWQMGC